MAGHAAGCCAGALLPQQKVSLLLLLLLVLSLSQHVQAQVRPAAAATDTWMPATTTTTGTGTQQQPASASSVVAGNAATTRAAQPGTAGSIGTPVRPAAAVGTTPAAATGPTAGLTPARQPPSRTHNMGGAAAAATTAAATGAATGLAAESGMPKPASAAASNPPGSLHNVLAKNAPLFRSLLTVLDISPEQVPASTEGTIFAPTDDAISDFLQAMNLTAKQLAARPELVDLIVSYHFAPGYQLPGPEAVANGTKVLLTGDEQYILRIGPASAGAAAGRSSYSNGPSAAAAAAGRNSNSKMVLTDVQKSKANIIDGPFTPESTPGVSVYLVDKVLRSANYFLDIESALSHSPYWISTKAAADKAGVLQQLAGRPVTMFVPDNAAFKPLEANLSRASTGRLAEILKYHVLPKVRRIPRGFESGSFETLLKGHSVDINASSEMQADPFSGIKEKTHLVPVLTLKPEKTLGTQKINVTYYNIFAGPAILHGINQVLLPDLSPDPNQLPASLGNEEDLEQPPDAQAPEQAGPASLEEAAKDVQQDEADGVSQPSAASTAQPGRTASGTGQRAGTAAGASTTTSSSGSSSSDIAGMAKNSIRPVATGASVGSMPTAGAGVGTMGTGIRAAASGPVTTEQGPSGAAAAAAGGVETPKKPSAWVPDAETEGILGRRRRLLLLLPRSMLAAAQQSRRLLAVRLRTAGQVLAGRRGLLQFSTTQRPTARAVGTSTTTAAAAGGGAVTPSGTLSSAVNVGAIGELQSFVNGVAANKTLQALRRAGESKVPPQYVNRYGSFAGATAKDGCLNCKAWGQPE